MKPIFLLMPLTSLMCSSLFAQDTVALDPATARFTYLASSEGPGVPGGMPNAYVLHFGMQGMFTITELPNNEGDITQADFILLGNEAAFQNNPQHRARIEATARQILLDTMFTVEHGPPLDRTVFRGDVSGPDLVLEFFRQSLVHMEGGIDLTFIDGEGFLYSYPIPEPGTLAMSAIGVLLVLWISRKSVGIR